MRPVLICVLVVLSFSGCAIAAPPSDVQGSRPSPNGSADPEAGATVPSDPFPTKSTPFDSASPGLRKTWRPYHVSLIPGHEVIDGVPKAAHATNQAGSGLSSAGAQALAQGFVRDQRLVAWAELNKEIRFRAQLMGEVFLNSTIGFTLAHRQAIVEPECALYPTAMTVHPMDPASLAALGSFATDSAFVITARFDGPCAVRSRADDGGEKVVQTLPPTVTAAFAATPINDGVLGGFTRPDAFVACTSQNANLPGCRL